MRPPSDLAAVKATGRELLGKGASYDQEDSSSCTLKSYVKPLLSWGPRGTAPVPATDTLHGQAKNHLIILPIAIFALMQMLSATTVSSAKLAPSTTRTSTRTTTSAS